jgi:hypothetical protein
MAKAKVYTGAKAKIFVDNVLVGIFDSCSYSVNVGAEPIHILGRFGPAEITPTSAEAVTVSCTGFRIIGNGGHVLPKFPKLQDLLQLESVRLDVITRDGSATLPIMSVFNCIPVSYSTGVNAKSTSRINISYLGTSSSDESGASNEGDAVDLP